MIKRFFYSDSRAAAHMAKHFGMAFDVNDFDGVMFRKWGDWQAFLTGNFHHFQKGPAKWYIHPESLSLLEPREDDYVCIASEGLVGRVFLDLQGTLRVIPVNENGVGRLLERPDLLVTQRNGIAVLWPQSEAAG
jgi:hypothetical protein